MHIEIQNCLSFWGTSSPDPLPWLRPWTPLGTSVPQTSYTGRPPHILYQIFAPGGDAYAYIMSPQILTFSLYFSLTYNVSERYFI